jgi:HK97 family phage portal protein
MKVTRTKYKFLGIPIFERAVSAESDLSNPAPWLYDALGGFPTSTGITVTEETALQFSAVYACVNVISDQLSSFPKGIFKRIDDRTRNKVSDSYLQYLIDTEPNQSYSAFDFWHAITYSVLLWGNGFAEIVRDNQYEITSFRFIHPSKVVIKYGIVDGVFVLFYEDHELGKRIAPRDMLHFKGLTYDAVQGQGVIRAFARESIGLSIAAEKFGAKFFGNDTLMTKYLSHPTTLSEEAMKHIQQSWQTANAGLENSFKLKVLEEGMKLENVGIPPEQAQFIATRQHQVEEICRWFKVQPHLIQHLLRSTNNNIEHQGIEFATQTLTPWVARFEKELNRKIFTEKEKKKYYVKFNMDSLLRGDIKTQTEYFRAAIQWGWMSTNEVRELKDMNPREGGDEYLKPMNMIGSDEENNTQNDEDKKSIRANSGNS